VRTISQTTSDHPALADVAIVGAGPIGLELAAALKQAGLDYIHLEARQIGNTIYHWPANTQFFSSPERVAIAGFPFQNVDQQKATGEAYLAYLRAIVEQLALPISTYQRVLAVQPQPDGFVLRTETQTGQHTYRCRRVVLATGGMARPQKLGVPGEDLPHVSHYFQDPHPYFRQRLLVVGGRNSALEAALRCWRCGAEVTISYRRPEFDRDAVKPHLLAEISLLMREGRIGFLPATVPIEITPRQVVLAPTQDGKPTGGKPLVHPADFVLLATGFVADMSLFENAGVSLQGEQKAPAFAPETMETNVPGLYVAGTAAAGTQQRYRLFIENCHEHVAKIVAALTGQPYQPAPVVKDRPYEV
jgi:thioredoxin reductase (NADPH)